MLTAALDKNHLFSLVVKEKLKGLAKRLFNRELLLQKDPEGARERLDRIAQRGNSERTDSSVEPPGRSRSSSSASGGSKRAIEQVAATTVIGCSSSSEQSTSSPLGGGKKPKSGEAGGLMDPNRIDPAAGGASSSRLGEGASAHTFVDPTTMIRREMVMRLDMAQVQRHELEGRLADEMKQHKEQQMLREELARAQQESLRLQMELKNQELAHALRSKEQELEKERAKGERLGKDAPTGVCSFSTQIQEETQYQFCGFLNKMSLEDRSAFDRDTYELTVINPSKDLLAARRESAKYKGYVLGERPPAHSGKTYQLSDVQWMEAYAVWISDVVRACEAAKLLHVLWSFEILSARVRVRNPFAPSSELISQACEFLEFMGESKAGRVQIIEDYSCLRTILLASVCRAKHHSIIERLSAKSGAPPHLLVAEVVTQLVAHYAPTNVETAIKAHSKIMTLAGEPIKLGEMTRRTQTLSALVRVYEANFSSLPNAIAIKPSAVYASFLNGMGSESSASVWQTTAAVQIQQGKAEPQSVVELETKLDYFAELEASAGHCSKKNTSRTNERTNERADAARHGQRGGTKHKKGVGRGAPPDKRGGQGGGQQGDAPPRAPPKRSKPCAACKGEHFVSDCNDVAKLKALATDVSKVPEKAPEKTDDQYRVYVKQVQGRALKRLTELGGEKTPPSSKHRAATSRGVDPDFGGEYHAMLRKLARTRHTCTRGIHKKLLVLAILTVIFFPLTTSAQSNSSVAAAFPGDALDRKPSTQGSFGAWGAYGTSGTNNNTGCCQNAEVCLCSSREVIVSNVLDRACALMCGSALHAFGSCLCSHGSLMPYVIVLTYVAFVCFGVKTMRLISMCLCTPPHARISVSEEIALTLAKTASSTENTSELVPNRTDRAMSDFECFERLPARAAVACVRAVPSRGSGGHNSDRAAHDSEGPDSDSESQELDEGDSLIEGSQTSDSEVSVFNALADDEDDFYCEEYDYVPIFGDIPEDDPSPAQSREPRTSNRPISVDERTDDLVVIPGGEIEWSLDTGIAQKIPGAFKHRLKDKNATRVRAKGNAYASIKRKEKKKILSFIIDSGSSVTQVPSSMVHLLDDIKEIPPVYFETAGESKPISRQQGTLRFKLKGVDIVFEIDCLVNPGLSKRLCLLSMESLDNYDNDNVKCKLYRNAVKCWGKNVPVRRDKFLSAVLDLEIVSGADVESNRAFIAAAQESPVDVRWSFDHKYDHETLVQRAFAAKRKYLSDDYDLVHRLCGHAHEQCCRKTAEKAKGLPSLKGASAPPRPCPCC